MPPLYAALYILYATVVASLLFVLSLAVHEIGHAVVARWHGLSVRRVVAGNGPWLCRIPLQSGGIFEARLFGLNGWCEFARPIDQEPPRVRLLVALAGPLASLGAAVVFWLVGVVWGHSIGPGAVAQVANTMAQANLALAGFNMIPIPPLDGWRALDAVLERFGLLRLSPPQRARLHAVGVAVLVVGIAAFFAARWLVI